MRTETLVLAAAIAVAVVSACYTGPDVGAGGNPTAGTSNTEPPPPPPPVPNGLPCEVAKLVEQQCASCHGTPPRTGAKTTLLSREDFSKDFEGRSLGIVSLERMKDVAAPMPPEKLLPDADVATFAKWVEAGMPEGTCGSIGNVEHTPPKPVCTSGRFWTEGDDEGDELMTPGQACISCHTQENVSHARDDDEDEEPEAPVYTAAGTVYPTLYEPDDCFGKNPTGTQVILEGADGVKQTLLVNRAGNFMTEAPLALPYKASIVRGDEVRVMKTAQTDGDCNGCHTAIGGDAPGRIVGP